MATRYFALVYGIVFLLAGILGFVPALLTPPEAAPAGGPPPVADGRLFGVFPVNAAHNAVHILFGIWGLIAYRALVAARTYARSVAVIYAILMVMGFFPGLNTLWGLVPLYGHDIWLHAILAAVAAYFGWKSPGAAPATTRT